MKEGPDIARVAALIGDPARANILAALIDGRALTAGELADCAGVLKQTASSHLSRLQKGNLLTVEKQGRHRYYRLANEDIAHALEALMSLAERQGLHRTRTGPRDPALRRARSCYNHLAGELAVTAYERLVTNKRLKLTNDGLELTQEGVAAFTALGVDLSTLKRKPLCRPCLDWSQRRHHLAGPLGVALLTRVTEMNWAHREAGTRIVTFTRRGEQRFMSWLN